MALQISIPGLHISLGIFYRLFGLLEDSVHKLDRIVALNLSPTSEACTASLATYVKTMEELVELREERQSLTATANTYDQVITLAAANQSSALTINTSLINSMVTEATKTRKKIGEIVSMQVHSNNAYLHKLIY